MGMRNLAFRRDEGCVAKIDQGAPELSRRASNKRIKQIALYDSAMALFRRASYQAVSVEDICHHAGYGRATFYRLFGEKAGLLDEMHRRLAASIDAAVGGRKARGLGALQLAIAVMREEVSKNDTVMADMIAEYVRSMDRYDPVTAENRSGARALVMLAAQYIREGQESGEIRKSYEPVFMAGVVMGQISLAFTDWARQGAPSERTLRLRLDQVVALILHGIAA